ncbi:uncharacterized protein AB675_8349 [Cyphellophora attinorum]|uniref:AB hydrolase-1 domain-containing protein n=1 Tax=Cyphellophora attinorum TaxID=1664694 RepID=A0A0N0NR12_9EURO|nr:uncharacterized protein AB675_8349 [Phialophora attinorum]KPI44299.1 hypothetical protein AB675_8349 [Phialophora attinorum]
MTESTLTTTHGTLSINTYGTPGKPDVLLLHGMSTSQKGFRPIVENADLLSNYRITTFDFPGHGSSTNAPDPPTTYTFPSFASAAIAVLQHLNITKVAIYGHSMGGHVAIELVHRLTSANPELDIKVSGYMITGTGPCKGREQFQESYATDSPATLRRQVLPPDESLQQFVKDVYSAEHQECWMLEDSRRSDETAKKHVFGAATSEEALDERKFIEG